MSPEEHDPAYLWDMLAAARRVASYVRDATYEQYLSDDMMRDAVERNLITIGEAARNVSRTFQKAHPKIPFGQIVGLRNIVVHDYGKVDHRRIWAIVTEHIPHLIDRLPALIPPPPEEAGRPPPGRG